MPFLINKTLIPGSLNLGEKKLNAAKEAIDNAMIIITSDHGVPDHKEMISHFLKLLGEEKDIALQEVWRIALQLVVMQVPDDT